MENPAITRSDHFLPLLKPEGKGLSLKIGTLIKAEVMEMIESGMVTLRITPPANKGEHIQGQIIRANTHIPMRKGDSVLLEVSGSEKDLKMSFLGTLTRHPVAPKKVPRSIPEKILKIFSDLSASRLKGKDFNTIKEFFRAMPEGLKETYPEFRTLEKLMPRIEHLTTKILQQSIEDSGVLLETRLKLEVLKELHNRNVPDSEKEVPKEGKENTTSGKPGMTGIPMKETLKDQKGLLLKIQEIVKDEKMVEVLKQSGLKQTEVIDSAERFIKNIEFFQLSSRINDTIYTFLPLTWHELRDGELLFRKKSKDGKNLYSCDINLDLKSLGRLSISVTSFEGDFYVSFSTERPDIHTFIASEKGVLDKRFKEAGLALKGITIHQTEDVTFGSLREPGVNVTV